LPDPVLPFWVEEWRAQRFPSHVRRDVERRVVSGLVARLKREGVAPYSDERQITLGAEGHVVLRYFVLNAGEEPDAFTTPGQGLAWVLNGQRQGTKDRYWVKRNTGLNFLWRRLVILVDVSGLTSLAKREVLSSTRETSKDTPLARRILERVREELAEDDDLVGLDEEARQQTLKEAKRSTSEKVKRQLANRVAAFMKGGGAGKKGGAPVVVTPPTPRPPRPPRPTDDSSMLDVPDTLRIVNDPVRIRQGATSPAVLEINAKNDFLPNHADALSVVIGPELKDNVRLRSIGRLLGGRVRLTLEADADAPISSSALQVALVDPSLPVLLTATGKVEVVEKPKGRTSPTTGGAPNIEINWIPREAWKDQSPPWQEQIAGECIVDRQGDDIAKVEWKLNEAFKAYEDVVNAKKLGEDALGRFNDGYAIPICWALFMQSLAEWEFERRADENGETVEVPDEYVQEEKARIARAVLIALDPDLATTIESER
jgi:hypothetical protein